MPTEREVALAIKQYHAFKMGCLESFLFCGSGYNPYAFKGVYEECGTNDMFGIWRQHVDEKKAVKYVVKLMEHYDIPLYETPPELERQINTFYSAKYGMFTCSQMVRSPGLVRYDTDLINLWERKH